MGQFQLSLIKEPPWVQGIQIYSYEGQKGDNKGDNKKTAKNIFT